MKKCPYCAEMIKEEATVCRYCGRRIKSPKNMLEKRGIILTKAHLPAVITGILILAFVIGLIVLGVQHNNNSKTVSFSVENNTSLSSIVGTYKSSDPDLHHTLEINSDGTYLYTFPPAPYTEEKEETVPGTWSSAVGGSGVWRDPMNEGVSYKLIGRVTTRDEGKKKWEEYWYITEDSGITDGVLLEVKQ